MQTPSIEFDRVSKKFRRGERHDSLKDLLLSPFTRRPTVDGETQANEFWSIRDLSFRVGPGDVLGIIGSNGAGKSTTLKLLTRILRPTQGTIRTSGRIGALIEIAAGFHPDLTGRENVFLQGAIMGMRRANIERHFDEIVAFAGMDDFIDTPVKRYSSGMNARLGFAIAAHLDPDILVIDEVLAVGDLAFQRRAFNRLRELASKGMPVVVVSHQLDKVRELCTRAILLSRGRVDAMGPVDDVLATYLQPQTAGSEGRFQVRDLRVVPERDAYASGTRVGLQIRATPAADWRHGEELVSVRVMDAAGTLVGGTGSDRVPFRLIAGQETVNTVSFTLNVAPGLYRADVYIWDVRANRESEVSASTSVSVSASQNPGYGPVHLEFSAESDTASAQLSTGRTA